jgi:hypothetical protein
MNGMWRDEVDELLRSSLPPHGAFKHKPGATDKGPWSMTKQDCCWLSVVGEQKLARFAQAEPARNHAQKRE